jgi:hypothetical protein
MSQFGSDIRQSVSYRILKSRRLQWTGFVAMRRDIRNAQSILVGNMLVRIHLEDQGDLNIALIWIFWGKLRGQEVVGTCSGVCPINTSVAHAKLLPFILGTYP